MLSIFVHGGVALAAEPTILVSNAWSRPADRTAVVYAILQNRATSSDRLVGAVSPAATRITLHVTSDITMPRAPASTSTSMDDMPMSGAMTSMKQLSSILVPARGTTSLKPGGYHLMLDLRRAVKAGQVIPLRLHFARAGWIVANARVRVTP